MYHKVGTGKHATPLEVLERHFQTLSAYPTLLPGEPLEEKLSICLTFDDAYFDLYHLIYPLLKKYNLRALVAACPRYLVDTTKLDPKTRLNVPYYLAMQDEIFPEKIPFCTYEELNQMLDSKHIAVASHSYSHVNMTFDFVRKEQEIITSKQLLEQHLQTKVTSFVYPFGRSNALIDQTIKQHYLYSFRIGDFFNYTWDKRSPLGRIILDNQQNIPFLNSFKKKVFFSLKGILN